MPADVDTVVLDLLLGSTRPELDTLAGLCEEEHRVIVYSSLGDPALP